MICSEYKNGNKVIEGRAEVKGCTERHKKAPTSAKAK